MWQKLQKWLAFSITSVCKGHWDQCSAQPAYRVWLHFNLPRSAAVFFVIPYHHWSILICITLIVQVIYYRHTCNVLVHGLPGLIQIQRNTTQQHMNDVAEIAKYCAKVQSNSNWHQSVFRNAEMETPKPFKEIQLMSGVK